MPASSCRRCGTCCRGGGPALHREDLPLVQGGILAPADLVTLRRGDYVADNVRGGVGPSPDELIKVRPGPDGRTCRFFRAPDVCAIHADRPAECRVLFCDAPEGLAAMYRQNRLTRFDILTPQTPLAAVCAHHEEETSLARLATLCRRALSGDAAARQEAGHILRLDAAYRELLPRRTGIAAATLLFHLGRPPALALPACRAAFPGAALYNPEPSA